MVGPELNYHFLERYITQLDVLAPLMLSASDSSLIDTSVLSPDFSKDDDSSMSGLLGTCAVGLACSCIASSGIESAIGPIGDRGTPPDVGVLYENILSIILMYKTFKLRVGIKC